MNARHGHRLSLAALGLGAFMLYGCAVAAPASAPGGYARSDSVRASSMFAATRVRPAPQAQAAAEPAPEPQPQVAAEPAPEPQSQIAAEPAPKQRGPLTHSEEIEIDNQVMP